MLNDMIKQSVAVLAVVLPLQATFVIADERLQWHGFVSQTALHSDANNLGGDSADGVAWDMREVGANISFRPDANWLLSAQGLARWAGNVDKGDARVDYAFVERALVNADGDRVSVAAGKIKNPFGFYNTTRDVVHTRPGILMPQSIYIDRMRNFFLAAPGVSVRGDHERESWGLTWQLSSLKIEADDPELEYTFNLQDGPGQFEGKRSWLGQVMGELDGGRWRGGLSLGDITMRFSPTPAEVRLQPKVLSLQYNAEKWSLTGEYALTHVNNDVLAFEFDTEGWYVQGTYRFTPTWQGWLRYENLYFDKDDKSGLSYLGSGVEAYLGMHKDWVAGVRYDMTPQLALSAEVHRVQGVASLSPQDNPGLPNARFSRDWNMLLLQLAYRF